MRLLVSILAFSAVVTLLITAAELYLDYKRERAILDARLEELGASRLPAIADGLWQLDEAGLRAQLDGMLTRPDLCWLEVRDTSSGRPVPLVVAAGQADEADIARDYPISYDDLGARRDIGVLRVGVTLDGLYGRLIHAALLHLAGQGIRVFLVSLFTLSIVWRLVTRHLIGIAAGLSGYQLGEPAAALRLERRPPKGGDELDCVVAAFDRMQAGLHQAYRDLQDDIAARIAAEAEITRLNAGLEQRVRQRTADLEAANKELAAFSYSVSHDLRAPLRRIEGFSRILLEEHGEALAQGRGLHCVERIRAGIAEMADMVDCFLKLARSTQCELVLERVDLSGLAATITAELAEKEPERNVAVDIQPGLAVDGDRRLLRLMLANLLDNAWKYTRHAEAAAIRFVAARVGGHDGFAVEDNGAGFDMTFADRLFIPFTRLHKAEEFEGTGIGLATAQRIIARHGGRIHAEGAPGRGARMMFTCWEAEA